MKHSHSDDARNRRSQTRSTPDAMPIELSEAERDAIISSVIASQALAGVPISREAAERVMDEELCMPLPNIS